MVYFYPTVVLVYSIVKLFYGIDVRENEDKIKHNNCKV